MRTFHNITITLKVQPEARWGGMEAVACFMDRGLGCHLESCRTVSCDVRDPDVELKFQMKEAMGELIDAMFSEKFAKKCALPPRRHL